MNKYDSSIETKKHIELVGENIDIICNGLINKSDFNDDLKDITLIDLLISLSNKEVLSNLGSTLAYINNNTYMDLTFKSNLINKEKAINYFMSELQKRKFLHDKSKLEEPEKSEFDIWTSKLANSTYGSEEYKNFLKELKVALTHHYSFNRHHPEHFSRGIKGMNIVDLTEMFCDWCAACKRHNDGDIFKSLEINEQRFGYDKKLTRIFSNTIDKYMKSTKI